MRRLLVVSGLAATLNGCTALLTLDDGPGEGASAPDASAFDARSSAQAADATVVDARPDSAGDAADGDANADAPDAPADAPDASAEPDAHAGAPVYGGGRVLMNAGNLVRAYWGAWDQNTEADCQNILELAPTWLGGTAFFQAIAQYTGPVDGGLSDGDGATASIPNPTFQYLGPRQSYAPPDGSVADVDAFVEQIAMGADPDTIVVVFFSSPTELCGGQDGCFGLTPSAHVPYVRVRYDGSVVDSSRALLRELVDVITDADGTGWTVPVGTESYPLADVCSRTPGGGGLGNETEIRAWDENSAAIVFATDGVYSAVSDDGQGRCVSSVATLGVLAAVGTDGGVSVLDAPGGVVVTPGFNAPGMPTVSDVSIAASRIALAWHGVWALDPDGGGAYTQAYPTSTDLSQPWDTSAWSGLPAPYAQAYSMDTTMQGDGRWDAFTVALTGVVDDAGANASLLHGYYESSAAGGWSPFPLVGLAGNPRLMSGPGATSFAPGRVDAFVLGAVGGSAHLLHSWCETREAGLFVAANNCDAPTGWEDLSSPPDGVPLVGDPDAASWPSGTTELGHFAVACTATDGTVRLFRYDDGAASWSDVIPPTGVRFEPDPGIAAMGDGRYWIAAIGDDGAVWTRLDDWSTVGAWSRTVVPGGATAIDVTAY